LPSPCRVPDQPNPQPVSGVPRSAPRRRVWPLLIVAAAVVLLSAGVWTFRSGRSAAETASPGDRTARVIRGALERTIRLTGTITTKKFASIAAPMMLGPDAGRDLLLVHIASAGSMVKRNQVIAEIDGQSVQDHLDDISDQINQLEMEFRSLQAQHYV